MYLTLAVVTLAWYVTDARLDASQARLDRFTEDLMFSDATRQEIERLDVEYRGRPIMLVGVPPGGRSVRFLASRRRLNLARFRKAGVGYADGEERCGLTGEPLRPDDGLVIVTSCHDFFPPRIVSRAEFDKQGGAALVLDALAAGWEAAQAHRHWFA